jgi:N-6 DNA Methylase/Eco57I restriction-modification methylase
VPPVPQAAEPPNTALEAVRLWRQFAAATSVEWGGQRRTWAEHIAGQGYVDEERLVQPVVFPAFVRELLGFQIGLTIAAERVDLEGKPDFTPADAVTHPFVFETKSSREGSALAGHDDQVRRYLVYGRPRIRRVVLTNFVGLKVYELNEDNAPLLVLNVDLRVLLNGDEVIAAGLRDARNLLSFLENYRLRELSLDEKVEQVRTAPDWNPLVEVTASDWVSARLDRVVRVLTDDVDAQIRAGALVNPAHVTDAERQRVLDELRLLAWRLGMEWDAAGERTLDDFLEARTDSVANKALQQYQAHLAYYASTRLLLVRVWEDLQLLAPVLYDGGFDHWMDVFQGDVTEVVLRSFQRAEVRYRSLFAQQNSYTWYRPRREVLIEAIYQLANTYLGQIESDVLGAVYERLLERIDRKLLGQYYTPRDVIRLMWDILQIDLLAQRADEEDRGLRVFDVASGSGGFLVDAARRLGARFVRARELGAALAPQDWMNRVAAALNGSEIQRFPAYLGELNLLIQLGRLLAQVPDLAIPPLGILPTDSLALHNPDALLEGDFDLDQADLLIPDEDRRARALRVKDPAATGEWFDVAVGNPPYIGEKAGAAIFAQTRERHPYWERFSGHHMDYFYWFVILGVSKLRRGGRFAFITTEYWLRATGARTLREYLSTHCKIEHLVLFRAFKLFADAPGQDSLIVVGERMSDPQGGAEPIAAARPHVSIYRERRPTTLVEREAIIDAMRRRRTANGVETFRAARSPNELGGASWSEVILAEADFARRQALRRAPLDVDFEEGVLSAANRMRSAYAQLLDAATLTAVGWPGRNHGIFVLDAEERGALGLLTGAEARAVRPFANTQDLLPYATVLPADHDWMLYLPAPPSGPDRRRDAPFPPDMPALERHLRRFKPILDSKLKSYNETRPWWSLHRSRPSIAAHDREDARWANYCLTANWGVGGRLVVGLAPARSVPAHGMHALLPPSGVPASYVNAVINSTAVQALADTLPPGYLRREDLAELGIPLVEDSVDELARLGEDLANRVVTLVEMLAPQFPKLRAALLDDLSLAVVPDSAWALGPGPLALSGQLQDVAWVAAVRQTGGVGTRIRDVSISETLFGMSVVGSAGPQSDTASHISVDLATQDRDVAEAVAALLRGIATNGGTFRDVPALSVPIDAGTLVAQHAEERVALNTWVAGYWAARAQVDEILEVAL